MQGISLRGQALCYQASIDPKALPKLGNYATALEKNELVLNGPLELTGVNVYNARCRRGFITSTYFLMYREENENKLLPGDFVIRMQDEKTIAAAYRWA